MPCKHRSGSESFDHRIYVQTRKWKGGVAVNRSRKTKQISFETNLAVENRPVVLRRFQIPAKQQDTAPFLGMQTKKIGKSAWRSGKDPESPANKVRNGTEISNL